MTRKAAAKRSEANAAVRRRAAGLDQRFKMSASVAGFPSINAATACLSFFVRSRRRALQHPVLELLYHTVLKGLSSDLSWKIYAMQYSDSAAVVILGCLR